MGYGTEEIERRPSLNNFSNLDLILTCKIICSLKSHSKTVLLKESCPEKGELQITVRHRTSPFKICKHPAKSYMQ